MNFNFQTASRDFLVADLPNLDTVVGALYAFKFGPTVFGWVGRNEMGEWIGWNNHGDFWNSYGKTRQDAAEKLMNACWREFSRPSKIEV